MKLRFHRFAKDAILPTRSHEDDAGLDMYAAESKKVTINDHLVRLGVGVDIPRGYVGLLLPRSSMNKQGIVTLLGVIDSGYTGEVKAAFVSELKFSIYNYNSYATSFPVSDLQPGEFEIHKGDRICQLVVVPIMCVDACWDTEKEDERGDNGFGSTGR